MDKVKATGLSPLFTENGSITFEQARLTFECKKLYADLIKPGNFIDKSITDRWYGGITRWFSQDVCGGNCKCAKPLINGIDCFGSVVILGGLIFVNFPLCIHLC